MTTFLRTLSTLAALCCLVFAQAQTEDNGRDYDPHHFHGCHFAKNKGKLPPLSDEQRSMTCGSNTRSDSLDVLNYAIEMDLTKFSQAIIQAACEVTFTAKEDGIEYLPLDLLNLTVDSVTWGGTPLNFDYDQLLLNVHLPQAVNTGEVATVTVHYRGHPTADPGGFGGLVFDAGIAYNLGIGLSSNPYNFGRSWHPCFDNFVERATYDLNIVTNGGRTGYAIGEFLGQQTISGDTIRRSYRMDLPLPTYLVGLAASNYVEINDMHSGQYGDYPILLVGRPGDQANLNLRFEHLPECIDAFESWFGPYRWGQVGFVMTPVGAMEHASLVAYPFNFLVGSSQASNERLMAHEFGHHWWGNITTLSCPENMWIKEGNAEYSAHLFTEFAFGKEAFREQVKKNQYYVLNDVHKEDDGFFTLSGIPYEQTYSRHTYFKGAALMHNLRGYLGDTLFQKGMTSVLDDFEYESVDDEQMRDKLTETTGIDLSHFFNGWLYQPGFASYEIDSVQVTPQGGQWQVKLFIQQKLREALNFHTNVPLEVTFYDENWAQHHAMVMVSGEFSEPVVTVPFEPVWQELNVRNQLNLGRMQDLKVAHADGALGMDWVDVIGFTVLETPDSALVNLIHHWVAPDADPAQTGVQLSSTHYWTLNGILPFGFKGKCTVRRYTSTIYDLDHELADVPDSLILLAWRPNAATPWGEYPWYKKLSSGFVRIDTMLPGDYAFASGSLPIATAVADVAPQEFLMKIFPNPTASPLTVQGLLPSATTDVRLTVADLTGRVLRSKNLPDGTRDFSENLDVENLPPGIYWLELRSGDYAVRRVEKFVKR